MNKTNRTIIQFVLYLIAVVVIGEIDEGASFSHRVIDVVLAVFAIECVDMALKKSYNGK